MGGENPAYIAAIHDLPCCVCERFGLTQTSPTEAHHWICDRMGNKRTHDEEAIPLCMCHHQSLHFDRDKSKLAIHDGKESWVKAYGKDHSYTGATQQQLAEYRSQDAGRGVKTEDRRSRPKAKAKIKGQGFAKGPKVKIQSAGFQKGPKQKIPSRKFGT